MTTPSTYSGRTAATGGWSASSTSSIDPTLTRSDLLIATPSRSTCPSLINSTTRLRDKPSMRATAASTRSPCNPSGTSRTFRSATRDRAPMMIIIAGVTTAATDMALAGDVDPLHDRQKYDQDRGG